jgi:hypothetical protein
LRVGRGISWHWGAVPLAALALAGCGSQAAPTATTSAAASLLTDASIAHQVADLAPDQAGAAQAVLDFWRDVQFSNFPVAYAAIAPALQKAVPYKRFVQIFSHALPYFLYGLRVSSVGVNGPLTTVYCVIETQSAPTPVDPPIAFNLIQVGATWRLATDPRNILGTSLIATSA